MSEDSVQTAGRLSRRAFLKGVGAGGASLAVGGLVARPVFAETPELWLKPGAVSEPPAQLHLQFGRDAAKEMVASWSTTVPVARPRLRLGTSPRDLDSTVEAFVKTYTDGLSGTQVLTYHAHMHGLRPDTEYHYQVLHNGSQPVAGSFRTAPRGRAAFTFSSFGDQSIPDKLGSPPTQPWTPYAGLVVGEVEARQPLFHLLNGDLCYANVAGREQLRVQTWRSFWNNNTRSARFRPWMPAAGNHENERLDGRPGLDPFKAYQTWFELPNSGSAPEFHGLWYTFRVGAVQVVSINNDDVCYQNGGNTYIRGYSGGAQKAWLARTLAAARSDEDVDWIVVCMHQVAMSTAIPFNGSELGIREEWLPLFDQFGVDLIVSGHEHHYERSFAVRGQEGQYRRPVPATHDVDQIDTGKGTVHMILGGGGHDASSYNLNSVNDGAFEAELLVPQNPGAPATPGVPIPLITPKPRERATWSATNAGTDAVASHARDSGHGYGFASFEVDPGSDPGGWTTITAHYHRTLDPANPADSGKVREFDSFTLRRRRADREDERDQREEEAAAVV